MSQRLSQIWQQFQQLFSLPESLDTTIETGQAVFIAAKTLQEQDASIKVLKSVLQNSSSLLDVLCLPMAQIVGADLPFMPIGIALLKFAHDIYKQPLSLEDCVFIMSQVAYLESTKEILKIHSHVNWDAKSQITDLVTQQLQKLNQLELDRDRAIQALNGFQISPLATAFNQVLLARLASANISKSLAKLLTQRIA
ncbi:hypothetical protein [Nostoc sp. TCL26-01]|uniref:hypothetical protein n=1 Tax=Nostoc sp. TCL26-01 TaxID=2576904 RepID=UPI0021177C6E|nr:hypothetical protein [Nostoc sp. TCL26-01]